MPPRRLPTEARCVNGKHCERGAPRGGRGTTTVTESRTPPRTDRRRSMRRMRATLRPTVGRNEMEHVTGGAVRMKASTRGQQDQRTFGPRSARDLVIGHAMGWRTGIPGRWTGRSEEPDRKTSPVVGRFWIASGALAVRVRHVLARRRSRPSYRLSWDISGEDEQTPACYFCPVATATARSQ